MTPIVQVAALCPRKKNPDIAELIRGKTGSVYGNLMAIFNDNERTPSCL